MSLYDVGSAREQDATGGVGPNAARPPLHRKRLVLDEVEAEVEAERLAAERANASAFWSEHSRVCLRSQIPARLWASYGL